MPNIAPVLKDLNAEITLSSTSKITNLAVALADTEVSLALTSNVKQLLIRARDNTILKYSFVSGESGSTYITIPKGCTRCLDGIDFSSTTLYIQGNKATTVEIEELY